MTRDRCISHNENLLQQITAELAQIKRLEDEAKEAEELRRYRAQQIPKANPVPHYIRLQRTAV